MKVELDLPDWVEQGQDLVILAGIEQVAHRSAHTGKWLVKVSRCVNCGECCRGHIPGDNIGEDGVCVFLIPDGDKFVCSRGPYRGYNCCVGDPILNRWKETNCKITYREG